MGVVAIGLIAAAAEAKEAAVVLVLAKFLDLVDELLDSLALLALLSIGVRLRIHRHGGGSEPDATAIIDLPEYHSLRSNPTSNRQKWPLA